MAQEAVDGALIAARILRRMPAARRNQILTEMKAQDEALAIAVQERVYNISELSRLSPKHTQTLVREVAHEDLVLSLQSAPGEVKQHLLENMSERKRDLIAEESSLPKEIPSTKIREAQWRVLEKLEELRERGLIRETKILALG